MFKTLYQPFLKAVKKLSFAALTLALLLQLCACGTILHPERKGQAAGQIDIKIALFDAIGLLFFFIPGVIAFAVDFHNGTIYLPGGSRAELNERELKDISPAGKLDKAALTRVLKAKGLLDERVQAEQLSVRQGGSALKRAAEIHARLLVLGDVKGV